MKALLYIFSIIIMTSCMDFRFNAKEMSRFLRDHEGVLVSDTLLIDNQRIHYVYTHPRRNTLLVFVHGSPGSWNAFSGYLTADSLQMQYDMVSVDRPGFGYSDYGYAEASLKNQAFLISSVMKQFDHKEKILIGHSLGGPVIARIAMDYPDLVQGMLFIAPSIDPEMEKYEWYRTLMKTWVGEWTVPTDFWVSNEEIVALKGELQEMVPLWKEIAVPCIVIQGTKDDFVPKENAEFARRMIKDSLVTINYLEGVRHFIPWTHSQEVVRAIQHLSK